MVKYQNSPGASSNRILFPRPTTILFATRTDRYLTSLSDFQSTIFSITSPYSCGPHRMMFESIFVSAFPTDMSNRVEESMSFAFFACSWSPATNGLIPISVSLYCRGFTHTFCTISSWLIWRTAWCAVRSELNASCFACMTSPLKFRIGISHPPV